jgi:hypothetical protein
VVCKGQRDRISCYRPPDLPNLMIGNQSGPRAKTNSHSLPVVGLPVDKIAIDRQYRAHDACSRKVQPWFPVGVLAHNTGSTVAMPPHLFKDKSGPKNQPAAYITLSFRSKIDFSNHTVRIWTTQSPVTPVNAKVLAMSIFPEITQQIAIRDPRPKSGWPLHTDDCPHYQARGVV